MIWLVTQPRFSPSKVQVKSKLSAWTAWTLLGLCVEQVGESKELNFTVILFVKISRRSLALSFCVMASEGIDIRWLSSSPSPFIAVNIWYNRLISSCKRTSDSICKLPPPSCSLPNTCGSCSGSMISLRILLKILPLLFAFACSFLELFSVLFLEVSLKVPLRVLCIYPFQLTCCLRD